jgi:hypothetical protein
MRALRAALDRDTAAVAALCTDDIRVWTPRASTASLAELVAELEGRDEAFSEVELDMAPLEVGEGHACAEWTLTARHTGPVSLGDGSDIAPTGRRVTVHGVTVAEFIEDRICSVRQYWDTLGVLAQLDADPVSTGS